MLGTQMSLEKSSSTSIRRAAVTATTKTMSQTVKPEREWRRWRTHRAAECAASKTTQMFTNKEYLEEEISPYSGTSAPPVWSGQKDPLGHHQEIPAPPQAPQCIPHSTLGFSVWQPLVADPETINAYTTDTEQHLHYICIMKLFSNSNYCKKKKKNN